MGGLTATRTDHVGLTVSDLGAAVAFFTDHLGCEVEDTWTSDAPYLAELLGHPDVTIRGAMIAMPQGDLRIELLEYPAEHRREIDHGHANPGIVHLALQVADVTATHERLTRAGVRSVSAPVTPTSGPNTGRELVYLIGPDGLRIELMQHR